LCEFGFDHLCHFKLNSCRTKFNKFCENWLVLTLNLHYTFYKKKTVCLFKGKTKNYMKVLQITTLQVSLQKRAALD